MNPVETITPVGGFRPRLFNFDAQGIRVIGTHDQPWFIAKDVCQALGIGSNHVSEALESLDDDEKGNGITVTLGGPQQMLTINESGLYCLIFKSRKPQARLFRKWVTAEVLPALRRTGMYSGRSRLANSRAMQLAPQTSDTESQHFLRLITTLLGDKVRAVVAWPAIFEVIEKEKLFFWLSEALGARDNQLSTWRLSSSYSRYLMRYWGVPVTLPTGPVALTPCGQGRHRVYLIEPRTAA